MLFTLNFKFIRVKKKDKQCLLGLKINKKCNFDCYYDKIVIFKHITYLLSILYIKYFNQNYFQHIKHIFEMVIKCLIKVENYYGILI